jgi:hypothetical protein
MDSEQTAVTVLGSRVKKNSFQSMLRTTAFLHDSITTANPEYTAHKKGALFLLSSDDAIIIMKSISSGYGSCLR